MAINEDLKKVIRVLKSRNLLDTTNNEELARLSGLTRKTISKYQDAIQIYAKTAPKPTKAEILSVDKKIVENYIDTAIKNTNKSKYLYSNILGAIAGFVLRQETELINFVNKPHKVMNIGLAFINLAAQIKARKDEDGKGTPIHSKNRYAEYLLKSENKAAFTDVLFQRSDNYKTGAYSKSWKLTKRGEDILQRSVELLIEKLEQGVTLTGTHIHPSICSTVSVTPKDEASNSLPIFFILSVKQLTHLSLPSQLLILNHSHPCKDSTKIAVSLANLSTSDSTHGRHYNIFTSLRSSERKTLDYINYDISSGIQIIAFSLVTKYSHDINLFEKYSLLFNYAYDIDFKRKFRSEIADELDTSIDEVKELLTAYANGGKKDIDKHDKLKEFYEESDMLRREVISVIAMDRADVLEYATAQSKKEFPEELDWKDDSPEEDGELARNKASVFFFIWTYFEKEIRDAMISVVDDGISVHDAVYSKYDLPCEDFEKAVLEQTEFEVKITN